MDLLIPLAQQSKRFLQLLGGSQNESSVFRIFCIVIPPYINRQVIIPIKTEAEIPKTRTGPATVNIFAPTPITYPSDLYSIAGETMELAKPVIGTKVPAPANFPIRLKMLIPVKIAVIPIKTMETTVLAEV